MIGETMASIHHGTLRRALILGSLLACILSSSAWAGTAQVPARADATLIEDPDGALANGSGAFVFAGRTNQQTGGVRRALVVFDVASVLPAHAVITGVVVRLYLAPSNPGPRRIDLHRVLADWSEGPSSSAGGLGAPSLPGDVTWLHTFYDEDFWAVSGGQFVGRSSAHRTADESGFVTWTSTRHLVEDVTLWLRAPSRNFGWVMIGDETQRQTSKSFASRESPDEPLRPVLFVTYKVPGEGAAKSATVSTEEP
jgi:hypothetical protein